MKRTVLNIVVTLIYLFALLTIIPINLFFLSLSGMGDGFSSLQQMASFIFGVGFFIFSIHSVWYTFLIGLINKEKFKKLTKLPLVFLALAILVVVFGMVSGSNSKKEEEKAKQAELAIFYNQAEELSKKLTVNSASVRMIKDYLYVDLDLTISEDYEGNANAYTVWTALDTNWDYDRLLLSKCSVESSNAGNTYSLNGKSIDLYATLYPGNFKVSNSYSIYGEGYRHCDLEVVRKAFAEGKYVINLPGQSPIYIDVEIKY